MPIITISRGSYYHARSIAEKLAAKLGYTCLSRDQIVDSLEEFHLPEIKLVRDLNDAFSVLDRFPHGKKRFKAAIKSAILQNFLSGNVVYHGLVGHHFVRNISHVLKVRIVAETKRRVADDMVRENITEEQARFMLKKDDEERRKWAMFLYGIDIHAPETYNLVINIGDISEDEAVDIIESTAMLPHFQETERSKSALTNAALIALVGAKLFDFPNATVTANNNRATITLKVPEGQQAIIEQRIEEMLLALELPEPYRLKFDPYF
jgi:cytidylate kinase